MRFWPLLLLCGQLVAQGLFDPVISIIEVGPINNLNTPLQEENRFNQDQELRTNDFQPLQQIAATDRQPLRAGAFYVSQGPEGPALVLPGNQENDIDGIVTPTDDFQILFNSTEETNFSRISNLINTQTFTLTYYPFGTDAPDVELFTISTQTDDPIDPFSTAADSTIIDWHIAGNAFHDLQYNGLTPVFTFSGATITRWFIDDIEEPIPTPRIRPGTKFKLQFSNGQTWILYFEQSSGPIAFSIATDRASMTGLRSLTGFVRVAAIETAAPTNTSFETVRASGVDPWSTAMIAQTFPQTSIAMFMLWPTEWVDRAARQITDNLINKVQVPECNFVGQLMSVLSMRNLDRALKWFVQIPNSDYGVETNQFVAAFNLFAARRLTGDISTYQTGLTPPATVTPSATTIEATFDANRTKIPILTDINFIEDEHFWTYTCAFGETNPLVIYPNWKILADAALPIAGFAYVDAVKGPLFGTVAVDNLVRFAQDAVPAWFLRDPFFPDFLRFKGGDLSRLGLYFSLLPPPEVTETSLVPTGQQVYQLAQTAATASFLFRTNREPLGIVRSKTEPYILRVKEELLAWFVTRAKNGIPLTDFFATDSTTPGLCASSGMGLQSDSVENVDDGNAIYNNHHLQYGYWLAAAAIVIDWDTRFRTSNPFITQIVTTFNGTTTRMKELLDLLWRDARNVDKSDPEFPFNRHGNPWEGHSTQNGLAYTPPATGRNQQNFAEDFNSWVATYQYATAILNSPALTTEDKEGYAELATFAKTNMQMTADSGELIYKDDDWIFSGIFADTNITVGNTFDTQLEAAPADIEPGDACVLLTR